MLNFIRAHPYFIVFLIVFLILLFTGVFALDFTWIESLFAAAVLSAIGVGISWFTSYF